MEFFDQNGIRFQYPPDWSLEKEENPEGWSATIQSPGTAFIFILCDLGMPQAEELAEATLESLKSDYPNLESEPAIENIGGQAAIGHDMEFFALDLAIECKTRCLYSPEGTVLILFQQSDEDEQKLGPALRALWKSIQVDME